MVVRCTAPRRGTGRGVLTGVLLDELGLPACNRTAPRHARVRRCDGPRAVRLLLVLHLGEGGACSREGVKLGKGGRATVLSSLTCVLLRR